MATESAVDKQISSYLKQLKMEQKRKVLSVLKLLVKENEERTSFEQELDRRWLEYKSGKAKTYTMEEAESMIRKLKETKKARKK